MANTIKILFWLRRSKKNKEGLVPLMLRLTYQNQKVEKATGYYVKPEDRNINKQRLKGSKDSAKQIKTTTLKWLNRLKSYLQIN